LGYNEKAYAFNNDEILSQCRSFMKSFYLF